MRLFAIFGLLGAVLLACLPGTLTLVRLWSDFGNLSYSHGFGVAAVCIWLIARERQAIEAAPALPSRSALIALLAATFAWIVFWRAGIEGLYLILMPLMVGLAIYAVFGRQVASAVCFALLFVYSALPIWDVVIPVLQRSTVIAVSLLLKIANVPASVQDTFVILPAGTFEIAGGCAGLHFFIVGVALAALLGELDKQPWRRRIALLATMAGLAMISNWIRVFIIIIAGHLRGMDHYLIHSHYVFGWFVFAFAVAAFLAINHRYFKSATAAPASGDRVSGTQGAIPKIAMVSALAALAVAPAAMIAVRLQSPQAPVRVMLPKGQGQWQGPVVVRDTAWQPIFGGAHATAQAAYRDGQARGLEAFAAFYGSQSQGAELIGFGNSLLGPAQRAVESPRLIDTPAGRFRETVAADATGNRSIVWSVYEVAGRRFVRPFLSQMWYGVSSLIHEQPSALVALRSECGPNCDDARATLTGFTREMGVGLLASARAPESQAEWGRRDAGTDQPHPEALRKGLELMQAANFSGAEAAFRAALDTSGNDISAAHYAMVLAGLIEAQLAQHELAEAKATHLELARVFPDSPPTRLLAARLLIAEGKSVEGVSELRRLASAEPDYLPGRLVLGRILLMQGNLIQAESQLKAVTAKIPEHPEASLMLRQIKLRTLQPHDIDDPMVLNNLAWLYFEEGDPRAQAMAQRAYELAPKNAAIADTYGWILYQKKETVSALPLLASAALAAPDEPEIQYHHAAALASAGRSEEARPILTRLLGLPGEFARRKDAEELLRSLPR